MKSAVDRARVRLEEILGREEIFAGVELRVRGDHLTMVREEKRPDGTREDDPRVRLTHLGRDRFGLSVFRHTGKWERTPFTGTVDEMAEVIATAMQHLIADWP